MRHHVFWFPDADQKLQEILASSNDKQELASVINDIDRWLVRSPGEFGESRWENVRIAFVRPLGVLFEILDAPPTVIVLDVWRTQ